MGAFSEAAATPSYRLLSEAQIRTIHAATLEILETVGVRVAHDEALGLLRGRGCNYLAEMHTARNYREEFWRPKQINRENPETWEAQGATRYGERVTARALRILATHQPKPLADEVIHALDTIVERADAALMKFQFVA